MLDGTGGTEPAGKHMFFYGKGSETYQLGTDLFFTHKRIQSAVKSIVSVSVTHKQIVIEKNAVFWDVMPCGSCKN
jgi:hypothetical protein